MKRRNFLVAGLILISSATSSLKQKTKNKITETFGPDKLIITNPNETVYLKRNQIVHLPTDPAPIDTIICFDISQCRFGSSPTIDTSGAKIDGHNLEKISVKKYVKNMRSYQFYMQYTGHDIGWVILT